MIISRTPLRISFFGGGTDYPIWYKENGGAVISTTINKFNYIVCRYLPPFFDYNYRIRYRVIEEVKKIDEIQHPSVRECLKFYNIPRGVEIQHNSDLPAMSGLGSSSSFTVGLNHALSALEGKLVTKRELALDAIHIEQNLIKENVGSQDQVATAFGGFNHTLFGGKEGIVVNPITIGAEKIAELQKNMLLFFTGFTRTASDIAGEQIRLTPQKRSELQEMTKLVTSALEVLNSKNGYNDFGRLLHENWKIKRSLTPLISNFRIDEIYETALKAGASGGKLLGAGSGGFMLFYALPDAHKKVKEKLSHLLHVPFSFESLGSQIIYYAPNVDF